MPAEFEDEETALIKHLQPDLKNVNEDVEEKINAVMVEVLKEEGLDMACEKLTEINDKLNEIKEDMEPKAIATIIVQAIEMGESFLTFVKAALKIYYGI